MGLSAPWTDYLLIIPFWPENLDINPMGISAPWDDSLEIITLDPVKNN